MMKRISLRKNMHRRRVRSMVTEALKKAIETCGRSRYALSAETGIDQGVLSRFVHGKADIRASTIEKLCEALDLELVPRQRRRRARGGR
ncbi:MAG: helix-turn-helix domain-containing protein [Planctomycetota bacterium JB042]